MTQGESATREKVTSREGYRAGPQGAAQGRCGAHLYRGTDREPQKPPGTNNM